MFLLLLAFWLLLNGRITAEIVVLGILICGVIYGWCCRVLKFSPKREADLARRTLFAVKYLFLLVWNVVLSGLQVMALTLSPKVKEVEPRLVFFKSPVRSEIGKVILSNSITLTPGTITCGVGEDLFCVHALDGQFAGGMEDSDFVKEIRKMEEL